MEQMGAHKSALPDVSAMELGDTVPARAGSALQVLHRLRGLRSLLYGTYLYRAYDRALQVRVPTTAKSRARFIQAIKYNNGAGR